jgi:hypothetical protein
MKAITTSAALAAAVLFTTTAMAQVMPYTISVSADDFATTGVGTGPAVPVTAFSATYTIDFDPSVIIASHSQSIEVEKITSPFAESLPDTTWGVSYSGGLAVGNDLSSSGYCNTDPGSGFLEVRAYCAQLKYDLTKPFEYLSGIVYYSYGPYEYASNATVSVAPAISSPVPEPSSWLLMISGIGVIGILLRAAKRKFGFPSGDIHLFEMINSPAGKRY